MTDTSKYVVGEHDTIDDVDLDSEVVRLKDGRRLTKELADELAEKRAAEEGVSLSVLARQALERYLVS